MTADQHRERRILQERCVTLIQALARPADRDAQRDAIRGVQEQIGVYLDALEEDQP